MENTSVVHQHEPWNKGKLLGQKAPLKLKQIWAIRVRLELIHRIRDLALFNLAIDNKLRACDLVKLKVRDISHGDRIAPRAIVMQQKTGRPVQFEITEQTRMQRVNYFVRFSDNYLVQLTLCFLLLILHRCFSSVTSSFTLNNGGMVNQAINSGNRHDGIVK